MVFRTRMTRFLGVFVCLFVASLDSEELPVCQTDSTVSCCLCPHITNCWTVCPTSLNRHLIENYLYDCEEPSLDTTTSTDISSGSTETEYDRTTMPGMVSTTGGNYSENTTDSEAVFKLDPSSRSVTVCLKHCPDGFYPLKKNCTKCDPRCKKCNESGTCTKCTFEYQKTCHAVCPQGTKPQSDACIDIVKDDNQKLIIIGASAGGGGLLVVIFVVVLVCCICRRRKGKESVGNQPKSSGRKTRMSGILEGKNGNTKPKGHAMGGGGSRPDYENTAPKDKNLSQTIQQQGDLVLRYTQDPTASVKNNTMKPAPSEPVNRDSTYANASMISMMRKMSAEDMTPETIEEHLDIEALPQAPQVPRETLEKETHLRPSRTKPSFVQRLSQKLPRRGKNKSKGNGKEPVETFGQTYMDMNYPAAGSQNTELKTNSENQSEPGKSQAELEKQLEDYENAPEKIKPQSKTSKETSKDEGQLKDYEKMEAEQKLKVNNGNKIGKKEKAATGEEIELEDYENTKELAKTKKIGQLKEKFETQKISGRNVERSQGNVNASEDSDLEDYENTKCLSKRGKANKPVEPGMKKDTNKVELSSKVKDTAKLSDLEDYENTSSLSKREKPAVAKKEKTAVSKTVEFDGEKDTAKLDDLEDYENTSPLSKREKPPVAKKVKPSVVKTGNAERTVEDLPYENIEIVRKNLRKTKA